MSAPVNLGFASIYEPRAAKVRFVSRTRPSDLRLRRTAPSAGTARSGDGDHNRHRKSRHLSQIACDRFRLTAFFGVNPRISTLCVYEREHRPREFRRQLHNAKSLPISLWLGLSEIAQKPLLGVSSLLGTHYRHRPAMKLGEAGNDGMVLRKGTVAVQLHEIGKQQSDKIERVRRCRMASDFGTMPDAHV